MERCPVHDFKELLNLGKLPGEERHSYLTLGGFVMMRIGRIPVAADSFEAVGLRFEVADMDGKRVDKVVVQPLIGTSRGKSNAILTRTLLISYQLWLIVRLVLMGDSARHDEFRLQSRFG
jgi:hypothetical protein